MNGSDTAGAGIFGRWSRDHFGLPIFEYELDQHTDPRGEWDTRLMGTSRLHWHQLGNDRIVAIGTNDGWVQLYSHEYGPRWINQHREADGAYAGGVSYLADLDAGSAWSTYYADRPPEGSVRRVFGCGYLRVVVRHDDLELDRITYAPFGDGRLLASRVAVRNLGQRARTLRHGEYWDAWLHNIDFTPQRGLKSEFVRRDEMSAALYDGYGASWDAELGGLRARHPQGPMSFDVPVTVGPSPRTRPDIVAVPIGTAVDGWEVDRRLVFGEGGRARPDALLRPGNGTKAPAGEGQEVALLLTTDLALEPGAETVLGFGYGAVPPSEAVLEVAALGSDPDALLDSTLSAWRDFVPEVDLAGEEWLTRELQWGAYYVRSGATYHHGFRAHTLSQGGAYQYLGGFNAGPRATVQHALPLVWLAPELAAEAARFTMAETTPEGEIAYAEVGTGLFEPVSYCPSDNDLWLLWLVAEYVLATRDRAFLRQSVSYWPAPYTRPEPVWDHCLRALDHLLHTVGVGEHGLLKLRLGDWNDTFVAEGGVPIDRVWNEGESTLNTAMAVHVLRRFAELADLAGETVTAAAARTRAEEFADAVRSCWRGAHLNRGWRTSDREVGHQDLFLEPQPWALIAGILDDDRARRLVREIRERCADPLATRIFAEGGEGNPPTAGGGQWLSINSTLAWGLAKVDPEEGWRELLDNTLRKHAEVYPETWFGVWSGPDTYLPSSFGPELAGQTWFWPGTFSMQAWPVQILFVHSEPLNASLWLAGIEPTARGLRVDPVYPFEGWTWDGGLLRLRYGPDVVEGALGALAADVVELELTLPSGYATPGVDVEVAGRKVHPLTLDDRTIRFGVPVRPGTRTPFRVGPLA